MNDNHYLANLLGAVALSATDRMESAIRSEIALEGQGPAALVLIGLRPGRSIKRLAERLRLSHAAAVRLVEGLAAKEMVQRDVGDDRRVVRLTLTPEGESVLARVQGARLAALNDLLDGLTPDQRQALKAALETVAARATRDHIDAYANCRLCDTSSCESEGCPVEDEARRLHRVQTESDPGEGDAR